MTEGRGATILDDLPESIIIEEILVRLPAQDVLRCRVVHKSWRHGTSTSNFLLAHYRRQPSHPVINIYKHTKIGNDCIFSVLNNSSATTIDHKLRGKTILQCPSQGIDKESPHVHAACDGLFILSLCENKGLFFICNPTTRKRAPLPLLREHNLPIRRIQIAAFYQHRPSGEYRVLYSIWTNNEDILPSNVDFYVLVLGSNKPRPIGKLPVCPKLLDGLTCSCNAPVLHRGRLHWDLGRYSYGTHGIMVFDTVLETCRWMQHPTDFYIWMSLLEMNNVLAMWSIHSVTDVVIYVMQDYEAEVWTLTHQINISVLEGLSPLDYPTGSVLKIVTLNEQELLIKLTFGPILHYDIDGKFLGKIECDEVEGNRMDITGYRFRENIAPLPFFDMHDDSLNSKMLEGGEDYYMRYSIWP